MSRRKGAFQVTFPCESAEAFDAAVRESDKKLVVMDIYQAWAGPCAAVEPCFRKAFLELDQAESRLKVYTVDETLMTDAQKVGLPVAGTCRPLFVVYKNRAIVSKIQGANAPELETIIMDNVPPAEEKE